MSTYTYMIHRFEHAVIFGDSEEYEEFTQLASMQRRLNWLVATYGTEFSFWAEDNDGNIYNAIGDEPCGYCGDSTDPNDICSICYTDMAGVEEPRPAVDPDEPVHTDMCGEYWDRGLDCGCIPADVKRALRAGANPADVM